MDNEKEIPFGAFDSELMHQEIYIPEGFEATIDGDKIILKKIESEDEKIRKSLIILLQHFCKGYRVPGLEFPVSYKDMLAWLEKQCKEDSSIQQAYEWGYTEGKRIERKHWVEKQSKQNPIFNADDWYVSKVDGKIHNIYHSVDKVEPKFKVSDWVVYCGKTCKITGLHNGIFTITNQDGSYFFNQVESTMEPIFHLWTIQDAKDGDVLEFGDHGRLVVGIVSYVNKITGKVDVSCLLEGDKFKVGVFYNLDTVKPHPTTKEQRDLLFKKMKEAGYEWDAEKKELKKIELSDVGHEYYSELLKNDTSDNIADYAYQCVYCMSHDWAIENPTWDNVQSACRLGAKWQKKHDVSEDWSEEDEKMIGRVRGIIEAYAFSQSAVDVNGDLCEKKFIDVDIWLKSIKDRVKSQNTWKPSNAQIRALEYIIDNAHNTSYSCKIAKELLEQLRKLKGE